jgi:hypothetical protein
LTVRRDIYIALVHISPISSHSFSPRCDRIEAMCIAKVSTWRSCEYLRNMVPEYRDKTIEQRNLFDLCIQKTMTLTDLGNRVNRLPYLPLQHQRMGFLFALSSNVMSCPVTFAVDNSTTTRLKRGDACRYSSPACPAPSDADQQSTHTSPPP